MRKILLLLPLFLRLACAQTANFPATVVTDQQMMVAANNVGTTLSVQQASTDTVLIVASTVGFQANMLVSVCSAAFGSTTVCSGVPEIEVICSVSGSNTLNIGYNGSCPSTNGRGFDSTTAAVHAAGSLALVNMDAWHRNKDRVEIEAIQQTLGANLSNIPKAASVSASTYNFTALSCNVSQVCSAGGSSGGSLVNGDNALTFTLVPLGINGTDSNHYLYVSGGTGTAEACKISGGSGTGGQTNGQIIIHCGFIHSGAWSIQSASGGLFEAIIASGGGRIYIDKPITLYTTVTPPAGRYTIDGLNGATAAYTITRASSFPNGDLFYIDISNFVSIEFCNMGVANDIGSTQTSAVAFRVFAANYNGIFDSARFTNMWVDGGNQGWYLQGSGAMKATDVDYYGTSNSANCVLEDPTGATIDPSTGTLDGGSIIWVKGYINGPNFTGTGFSIGMIDGMYLDDIDIFGWGNAISLVPANLTGTYISTVSISNIRIDGPQGFGIIMENNYNKFFGLVSVTGSHLDASAGSSWGIDVIGTASSSVGIVGLVIANNTVNGFASYCVGVGATQPNSAIIISNNVFQNCNGGAAANTYINLGGSKGIAITGNTVIGSNLPYALATTTSTVDANIQGNDFSAATTAPVNLAATLTGILANNKGVNDGMTFTSLPSAPNGTFIYCTNCNSTCTGTGTGQSCVRVNGTWTH